MKGQFLLASFLAATVQASADNACAEVRELYLASGDDSVKVPAQLAYDCMTTVPFNQSAAVVFMDSIRPFLDWHTTFQYLKEPPQEFAEKVQPPYDFFAAFEAIYSTVRAGGYSSEFAFGNDVYRCFTNAHDNHLSIGPDSLGIFAFGRSTPLVSVSLDGMSIPKVYVYSDILETTVGKASFAPSPVALIDGRDSTEFLLEWSDISSPLQDRDARWNDMFHVLAQVSLGINGDRTGTFSGGGRGRYVYPGPSTTLTFANGSSVTSENYARTLAPFDDFHSGPDIYKFWLTVDAFKIKTAEQMGIDLLEEMSANSSTTPAPPAPNTAPDPFANPPAPGYPDPVIRGPNNYNSGYFLDGDGFDDVAVLSLASFASSSPDPVNWQAVNTYLIDRAVAANKTKLIIDLSANSGGLILPVYDIFKLLFPSMLPYGASRFRAHEAFDFVGQEVSYFSKLVERSMNNNDSTLGNIASEFDYHTDSDVNYEPFTSWADKYGPHPLGPTGDLYTDIVRWNLSDVLNPYHTGPWDISGYRSRTNITTQPFAAENIVVVTDGYCSSGCSIFSELMRQQAGVKYVVLGGRPNTDITQAVGGTKGSQYLTYETILNDVLYPFQTEYVHSRKYYEKTVLANYNNWAYYRTGLNSINYRNAYRQGDETNTPLQFMYEPADCRIFYTPEMVVDQAAVWKTVADAAWNGVKRCVAGSLGTSAQYKRSLRESKKHGVRNDLNLAEHMAAVRDLWTGKGGVKVQGDRVVQR
ncbi:unnamed protein product [Zymoseptoria tritici ST99CH_1A5]|nr:unnamed protein product [Zymoseptoria tritici ST99CH_1A5]